MDTDAYRAVRSASWDRLDELAKTRRLTGAQIDELVRLYHASSRDLSVIRTSAPDPGIVSRLSISVAGARARLTGTENFSWTGIVRFVTLTLPLAFYRVASFTVAFALVFTVIATAYGWAFYHSPALQSTVGTPSELRSYAEEAFTAYYTNYPSPDFAAQVWTNNAFIAAIMVASGITGVGPILVGYTNAVGIGQAGAILALHHHLDVFFLSILPHGMLELTAVFVAGGAGLRLCWAWISPGDRSRAAALAEAGRTLAIVAFGLVFVLGLSGAIEGFVTGSNLPVQVKLTLGFAAFAAYWAYTLILGRRAVALGHSGDLSEDDAGYRALEEIAAERTDYSRASASSASSTTIPSRTG
ncbi:MAG: stage II sporulation protein M [Bowdeniella nasicola]|nr:stage II sporulation protein M [Bowdeniella nasicola]